MGEEEDWSKDQPLQSYITLESKFLNFRNFSDYIVKKFRNFRASPLPPLSYKLAYIDVRNHWSFYKLICKLQYKKADIDLSQLGNTAKVARLVGLRQKEKDRRWKGLVFFSSRLVTSSPLISG